MSTRGIARGILRSVRLAGATAALAAGIAGFASVGAEPAQPRVAVAHDCPVVGDHVDGPPVAC